MKVTPSIINHEFIGTHATIIQSPHPGYVGISGKVVDETKNTFMIQQNGEMKRIVKDTAVMHFTFSDDTIVEISGKLLVGKPEDRLKKTVKRLW